MYEIKIRFKNSITNHKTGVIEDSDEIEIVLGNLKDDFSSTMSIADSADKFCGHVKWLLGTSWIVGSNDSWLNYIRTHIKEFYINRKGNDDFIFNEGHNTISKPYGNRREEFTIIITYIK